jgi:hypothetical protein
MRTQFSFSEPYNCIIDINNYAGKKKVKSEGKSYAFSSYSPLYPLPGNYNNPNSREP